MNTVCRQESEEEENGRRNLISDIKRETACVTLLCFCQIFFRKYIKQETIILEAHQKSREQKRIPFFAFPDDYDIFLY